jgi:DNA polymerase
VTDVIGINDICFFDTETRALPGVTGDDGDVSEAGTYRYAKNSFVTILTYAIGADGPVQCVALDDFGESDDLPTVPHDLWRHLVRVEVGEAWMAAWNAGFDRQAWNHGSRYVDELMLKPQHVIDVMAQAMASNLPPALEGAARALRLGGKQEDGKALIKLFSSSDGGTPQSHPEEWARFKSYAVLDTALLRDIYKMTRPLPISEWREYWASERINDRGMAVDLEFCRRASAVAALDLQRTNALIDRFTNGQIQKVTQHQKLAQWVYDALGSDGSVGREIMVSEWDDEDEDDIKVGKLSLERDRVTKLITWMEARSDLSERDEVILNILRLREFGASAAPKKFDTILRQHDEGSLRGSYVWNGAGQTGRFSAKGVQVHNMTRSVIGKGGVHEIAAIEMINELEL